MRPVPRDLEDAFDWRAEPAAGAEDRPTRRLQTGFLKGRSGRFFAQALRAGRHTSHLASGFSAIVD